MIKKNIRFISTICARRCHLRLPTLCSSFPSSVLHCVPFTPDEFPRYPTPGVANCLHMQMPNYYYRKCKCGISMANGELRGKWQAFMENAKFPGNASVGFGQCFFGWRAPSQIFAGRCGFCAAERVLRAEEAGRVFAAGPGLAG